MSLRRARNIYCPNGVPAPIGIGELFARTYSSGNYAVNGGATAVFNSNNLQVNSGSSTFNKNVTWENNLIDCENFTLPITVTLDSAGIAPVCSLIGVAGLIQVYVLLASGTVVLRVDGTNYSPVSTIGVCSTGDVLTYLITMSANVVSFAARNVTTASSIQSVSRTYNLDYPFTEVIPSAAKIGFCSYTGDYTFTWTAPSTTDQTLCDLYFLGTSKIKGYFASGSTFANRVSGLWAAANPTKVIINSSGANELSGHMASKNWQIDKYLPRAVIIGDISNDVRFSQQATTAGNLTSIRNKCVNLGIPIYIQTPLPENVGGGGVDLSSQTAIIAGIFAPGEIIGLPGTWNSTTDNEADGIHWKGVTAETKIYVKQATVITL